MNYNNTYLTSKQAKISLYAKTLSHLLRVLVLNYLADNLDKCCCSDEREEELPIARNIRRFLSRKPLIAPCSARMVMSQVPRSKKISCC